jgi:glutaryl-CoA dehydrogenase (non-decarboxylating)
VSWGSHADATEEGTALGLTDAQEADREAFRQFVDLAIAGEAGRFDREQALPESLVRELAGRGYLGATLPKEYGGGGMDLVTYGLLTEEIGRACSSVRSLLTVHDMVGEAIARWGTPAQRSRWLPVLASGSVVGAFALTEPDVGSDAGAVRTEAAEEGGDYVLSGRKRWISFGQIAGLFLVFARCQGRPTAFLVERDTPGLTISPITGLLGMRAAMLAELRLEGCRVPHHNLLGQVGVGVSHVAATALSHGRYSVAWGCVGIGQACLDASMAYAGRREQFGVRLEEHQLVRRMLSDMITDLKAARLLCVSAGRLRRAGHPGSLLEVLAAKYFASRMASRAAGHAVQIHGANGCSEENPVARYYRDAKIMEIIEGSTEILQIAIARYAGSAAREPRRRAG